MAGNQCIDALIRRFATRDGVSFTDAGAGMIHCRLQGPAGHGSFLLQGAQLWSWTPTGEHDLLWQSPAPLQPGLSPYGGVPVCWPWLGVAPRADLPFHGLVRLYQWHLDAITADGDGGFTVRLSTDHHAAPIAEQPFALEVVFTLGARARVDLRVRNTGTRPLASGGALHSYLRIGQRQRIALHGLQGLHYRGEVDEPLLRDDGAALDPEAQWSRNYYDPDDGPVPVRLADPDLARTLLLARAGSSTLTLWNPGVAGAARNAAIGAEQWHHFVCLEAGNIHRRAIELQPGQQHVLSSEVGVADG